jgi:hypothetical protein
MKIKKFQENTPSFDEIDDELLNIIDEVILIIDEYNISSEKIENLHNMCADKINIIKNIPEGALFSEDFFRDFFKMFRILFNAKEHINFYKLYRDNPEAFNNMNKYNL